MPRLTTSARRRLDGPWTKESPPPPRFKLEGAARLVIGLPAALILVGAIILLVYLVR
jgi:hypothetical protein